VIEALVLFFLLLLSIGLILNVLLWNGGFGERSGVCLPLVSDKIITSLLRAPEAVLIEITPSLLKKIYFQF